MAVMAIGVWLWRLCSSMRWCLQPPFVFVGACLCCSAVPAAAKKLTCTCLGDASGVKGMVDGYHCGGLPCKQ